MPQSLQAGFYQQLNERLAVMGDFTWMDWSRFGRVDVSVSSVSLKATQREIHSSLQAAISGNGRIDQQSNPRAGRVRGESDDTYSLVLSISFVWRTEPI